jgi:predicted 3-demethylubiquinone-9 3-methyltransferase (glyoxalase superfamily)
MTTIQQKIVPHLWYDKEAREAAEFYTSLFPDSHVTNITVLGGTPSGDAEIVSFELWRQKFMAISAGPYFRFTQAVSLIANFDPLLFSQSPSAESDATALLDAAWEKLSAGGKVLLPIGEYPFSKRYGWVQDRYGLSWQLILTDPAGEPRPPLVPFLMFVGENCGRAEEAIDFYLSVFENGRKGTVVRHGAGREPDREGTVLFADFMLENVWLASMDSAPEQGFSFNEAFSFVVSCDTQQEIDHYWTRLSAAPEAEQCGWLKDKFGVSWQIVPSAMDDMLQNGSEEQIARVTRAFLGMKKFDIAELQRAFDPQ